MASRLLPLPLPVVVFVMAMASLVALLLQSSAATTVVEVPHIEMVRGSNDRYNNSSSSNDICGYVIIVRNGDYTGDPWSILTFDVYDKYGKGFRVKAQVSFGDPADILEVAGTCISRPCKLVVTGNKYSNVMMKYIEVVATSGAKDDVTFKNAAQQWIGPAYNMQLQINYCDSSTMQ